MIENIRTRWLLVILSLILGAYWLSPNFVSGEGPSWLPKKKIVPGLDIQGGLHMVLGVDVKSVVTERTNRLAKDLEEQFRENAIPFQSVQKSGDEEIVISTASVQDAEKVKNRLQDTHGTVLQLIDDDNNRLRYRYYDAYIIETKSSIVQQAVEVIRNRIDAIGVAEPNISAQGEDRILVQLPGVKNSNEAKELVNRTAKLDFRVVSTEVPMDKLMAMIKDAEDKHNIKLGGEGGLRYPEYLSKLNEVLKDQLPANTRIYFEKLGNAVSLEAGRQPYLLRTDSSLSGDLLEDAAVVTGQYGEPVVSFQLNVEGTAIFRKMTEENVRKQIAIVLDDVVNSAPVVNEPIPSGRAQITLNSAQGYENTLKEARLIATALRAGALPAALQQLEERTVGPSLGADAIAKGEKATLIACILVFAFMIFYYRGMGLVADITLVMNLMLTFAVLSALGATLTLPGVAGMALTIGMAVDANIIIFERIKEEWQKGASMIAAVRDGFGNAFSAIFDANVTTVLTCIILMIYGTGPVRGFAVTLTIGLAVSMFTSIFVSRTMLETMVLKMNYKLAPVKRG